MADDGDTATTVSQNDEEKTIQAFAWIGFTENQCQALADDIGNLADIRDMSEKELESTVESFRKLTVAQGQIRIGTKRGKLLNSLIHFLQDQFRIGIDAPTLRGYDDTDSFVAALRLSKSRATIRKSDTDTMETRAKQAIPKALKHGKDFMEWESSMVNYLSILRGVIGVPLAYIIREDAEQDAIAHEDEEDPDKFDQLCVARCPLAGSHFAADARQVHQIITTAVAGESAEEWIKDDAKKNNGRIDMQRLRAHYRGDSNKTKTVGEAEELPTNLYYKSESAFPFQSFVTKCQKMFTLFKQAGEPYTEAMKTRFLLDKIESPELSSSVVTLRLRLDEDATSYDFTGCTNFLSAQVSTKKVSFAKIKGIEIDELSTDKSTWLPKEQFD